jgi:hypothetical protein
VNIKYSCVINYKISLGVFSAYINLAHLNCKYVNYSTVNLYSTAKFVEGMLLETRCRFPTLILRVLTTLQIKQDFFQVLMVLSHFLRVHLLVPKDFATYC